MDSSEKFLIKICELINEVKDTQLEKIDKMAEVLADSVAKGNLIHIWGPGGHSSMFAEDVMYRKGELAAINPIIDPNISLSHGASKEINSMERLVGLGKIVVKYNRIKSGDVVLFGSAYGVNPVLIEAVMECKRIGAKVMSITSPSFSNQTTFEGAMHDTKKVLYELSDIYIDSFVPYGDAVVDIDGFDIKVAPVATIMQLIVLKAVTAQTIEKLVKMGIKPPIWSNSLKEGGVEANEDYMNKIWGKVKSL